MSRDHECDEVTLPILGIYWSSFKMELLAPAVGDVVQGSEKGIAKIRERPGTSPRGPTCGVWVRDATWLANWCWIMRFISFRFKARNRRVPMSYRHAAHSESTPVPGTYLTSVQKLQPSEGRLFAYSSDF